MLLLTAATVVLCAAYWEQKWDTWTPKPINIPPFVTNVPLFHAVHVAADVDSAEDVADDPDAVVDEEEDDDDDDEEVVLVEEDQMRSTVCVVIYGRF